MSSDDETLLTDAPVHEPSVSGEPVELVELDRRGVIVAANRAWFEFCRANGGDESLVGPGTSYLAACDVADDEDPGAAQVARAVRAAVRGDLPAPMRIRIPCHAPGAERWFDILVSSRLDDVGECLGATVTLSRAAAPPPRLASWRAFDLVPDAVFVLDARLRVEYVNAAGQALLGYSARDAGGLSLADLAPDFGQTAALAELTSLRRRGGTLVREYDLRGQDGAPVPVEAHICATADDVGRPRFVVAARDLRPRRSAEAMLRAGEESFGLAFEAAPIGMAVVGIDQHGHRTLLRVNSAFAALFGAPIDRLTGRDLGEFSAPGNRARERQVVSQLLSGARTGYAARKAYRRADGAEIWTETRVIRVDLPGFEGTTTLGHFVDVTERHRAEQRHAQQAAVNGAVAEIVTRVLAGIPRPDLYQLIVDAIAHVFGAQNVTLGLPDPATGRYGPVAAVGPASTLLLGGKVPPSQEFVRRLIEAESMAMPEPPPDTQHELRGMLGPGAAARFGPSGPSGGLITLARPRGSAPFSGEEVALLVSMARQVALAVELDRARADSARLMRLQDRQRIARDLHDTVIQDLIAIGMQLDAGLLRETDPARLSRDTGLVDQLEEAVRRLRGSVFDLREANCRRGVAGSVHAVAVEAARVLGHSPSVQLEGPVDAVPALVAEALVAVLREGLSNVARHARASATEVSLAVRPGHTRLTIDDNGRGLPDPVVPGDGLANLRKRAALLHGQASVERRPPGGTRLTWCCPL